MYWQDKVIRSREAITIGTPYELDLPESGLLGSIMLEIDGDEQSAYGQNEQDWRVIDVIKSIEIQLESTRKAKSLTGKQALACAVWDQGFMGMSVWRNYAANNQREYVLINFGRKYGDPDMGLDLSRYDNVKLAITDDDDGGQFTNLNVRTVGHYLRDAPARQFQGFLKTEQWKTWTTAQNTWEYSNLPTELAIRRVMLQCLPDVDTDFVAKTSFLNLADDIRYNFKTGEVQVYEGSLSVIARLNAFELGKSLISAGFAYQLADDGIDMGLGYIHGAVAGGASQDGGATASYETIESSKSQHTQKKETHNTEGPMSLWTIGVGPFLTVLLPGGMHDDPAWWVNPEQQKVVELNVHTRDQAAAVGGTNAIVLDRFQPYR